MQVGTEEQLLTLTLREDSRRLAFSVSDETEHWTVDDPTTMRALLAMGVDGISTNRPDLLRAEIDAAGVGVPAAVRGNPGDFEAGCPGAAGSASS